MGWRPRWQSGRGGWRPRGPGGGRIPMTSGGGSTSATAAAAPPPQRLNLVGGTDAVGTVADAPQLPGRRARVAPTPRSQARRPACSRAAREGALWASPAP